MAKSGIFVVTGANRGIGLECVRRLCEALDDSSTVVLCSRNKDSGEAAAQDIRKSHMSGCQLVPTSLDIASDASVEEFVTFLQAKFGRVDGVIHNAGFSFRMVIPSICCVLLH